MNKDKAIKKEIIRTALVTEVANHYVENKSTMRKTAEAFGRSKAWVYRILRMEVGDRCPELKSEVDSAIKLNKDERYSRGGKSTNQKRRKAQR